MCTRSFNTTNYPAPSKPKLKLYVSNRRRRRYSIHIIEMNFPDEKEVAGDGVPSRDVGNCCGGFLLLCVQRISMRRIKVLFEGFTREYEFWKIFGLTRQHKYTLLHRERSKKCCKSKLH